MADRLGISCSNYSKIEVGLRKLNTKVAAALASEFGVNTQWLLTGHGQMLVSNQHDDSARCVYPDYGKDQVKSATVHEALHVLSKQFDVPEADLWRECFRCVTKLKNLHDTSKEEEG